MQASLTSYVKRLFGSEEHADCDVRFYQGGSERAPVLETSDGWLSEKIPGHLLILAAHSERLKAQADNPWWPQQQAAAAGTSEHEAPPAKKARASSDGSTKAPESATAAALSLGRPLLAVPLEGQHEVEPVTNVLRMMYQGLPPDLSLQQLLMARKLALYLLAPECAAACAAALADAPTPSAAEAYNSLTDAHVACMFDDPAMSSFTSACATALGQHYGSTLAVARSEELQAKFCGLPAVVLHQLLAPNGMAKLPADCEDTVLLLLHCWVQHNKPPSEIALQLRTLLRPLRLSTTYLMDVLPTCKWLGLSRQDHADLIHALLLTEALSKDDLDKISNGLVAHMHIFADQPQWLERRRGTVARSNSSSTEETISATFTRKQLQQMQAHAQPGTPGATCDGPSVYWHGFTWWIEVGLRLLRADAASTKEAPKQEVIVCLCNCLPPVFEDLGARTTPFLKRYTLYLPIAGGRETEYEFKCYLSDFEEVFVWDEAFKGNVLDPGVWEPLLVDGALTVRAVMRK